MGGPVIICLLFHLPTFMARGPSGPAFHCQSARLWRGAARAGQLIIAFLCNLPPVMARGPSLERALCGRPSYHLPFVSFAQPLWRAARVGQLFIAFLSEYGAARGPSGPAYHCFSVQFAPVLARGPSSERALRRRPSYHLPFVSFAHLYGTRPERASFSLPFCPIFPRYGAWPERARLSLPSASFAPVTRDGARPRSERSVGDPVIICLLFHLPTFMACGPAFHCLFCPIFTRYGAWPKQASLSLSFWVICPRYGAWPVLGASAP